MKRMFVVCPGRLSAADWVCLSLLPLMPRTRPGSAQPQIGTLRPIGCRTSFQPERRNSATGLKSLTFSQDTSVGALQFTPTSPNYTFDFSSALPIA